MESSEIMAKTTGARDPAKLRSREWFDNPDNPDMTALYLERYLNFGLTREELQSGKPIIGIAQTGSDLSPCNRHHLELAEARPRGHPRGRRHRHRVPGPSDPGDRQAPDRRRSTATSPISAWSRCSTATPIDGVVLTIGCDKTTPAQLMAAATVNIPAIALSVGPMLNGWFNGERTGSGTIVWKAREMMAAGEIDRRAVHRPGRLLGALDRVLQHHGHGDRP